MTAALEELVPTSTEQLSTIATKKLEGLMAPFLMIKPKQLSLKVTEHAAMLSLWQDNGSASELSFKDGVSKAVDLKKEVKVHQKKVATAIADAEAVQEEETKENAAE